MRRGGSGQRGFAEAFLGAGGNHRLEGIAAQTGWQPLARLIDALREKSLASVSVTTLEIDSSGAMRTTPAFAD
jgi:hypothetical protein